MAEQVLTHVTQAQLNKRVHADSRVMNVAPKVLAEIMRLQDGNQYRNWNDNPASVWELRRVRYGKTKQDNAQ